MDDVSEYFKNGFLNLHKNAIAKNYQQKTLKDRLSTFNDMRRETRNTLMFQKRQINENMTPLNTPEPPKNKQITNREENKSNKRLEMLQKWKMKKEKQKQEQKQKAKPVFKVCRVSTEIGLPDLENVNKKIKGKPIKSMAGQKQSQFAPPNHKFHAPKNIKPIPINNVSKSSGGLFKSDTTLNSPSKNKEKPVQRNTRATSRNIQLESNKVNMTKPNRKYEEPDKDKRITKHTSNQVQKVNGSSTTKNKSVKAKESFNNIESKETNTTSKDSNKYGAVKKSTINKAPAKPRTNHIVHLESISKNISNQVKASNSNKSEYQCLSTAGDVRKKRGNEGLLNVKATPKKNKIIECVSNERETLIKTGSHFDEVCKKDLKAKLPKKSRKLHKKNVAWNQVEVVGDQLSSADVNTKTPKAVTRIYNKTPRRKRNSIKSDEQLNVEHNDEEKNGCGSPTTPKNMKKPNKLTKTGSDNKLQQLEDPHIEDYNVDFTTKSASPDYPVDTILSEVQDSFCTPSKGIQEESPVYISPFVTVSRGKSSARKEYHVRHSGGHTSDFNLSTLNNTSPKVGADYFSVKLNNEISRIEGICDTWDIYKNTNNIPEEAVDMIDVAIGQSKLLISKKFQQFRHLIEECRKSEFKEKPITCEDLHGFWDMIYMQVEDLNKRFSNLDVLKANNWQEIIPEKKAVAKRGRGRPKKASASAALKNLIKAARDMKKASGRETNLVVSTDNSKVFDGGYYKIESPIQDLNEAKMKNDSIRRSLRVSLLTDQAVNRLSSSPGFTMMKISQAIKCGDGITPSKSILKNSVTKSAKRITKSVLFKDDLENNAEVKTNDELSTKEMEDKNNKENDINEINLISFSPATPVRRSKRISNLKK